MTGNSTYRKVAAALLLFCLLFTTVVQLSHSHKINPVATAQQKKLANRLEKENYSVPGADTKCFICEYQLTKDADISHCFFHFTPGYKIFITEPNYSETFPIVFISCFENRGPPAAII